jgi:hypothetical protein
VRLFSTLRIALVAFVAFSGARAFAATLDLSAGNFGAGSTVVAACGSGMSFGYSTTFDPGIPGYAVDGIDLTNIPAGCLGKSLSVTFYDSGTDPVGTDVRTTLPASGTTQAVSVSPGSNTIPVSRISGISVVVS